MGTDHCTGLSGTLVCSLAHPDQNYLACGLYFHSNCLATSVHSFLISTTLHHSVITNCTENIQWIFCSPLHYVILAKESAFEVFMDY